MSTNLPAVSDQRGVEKQADFGRDVAMRSAEMATAAIAAREEAYIKAMYVMAERHPRNMMDVRTVMLRYCETYRFAEIARYAKPVGRKQVNGEWVEQYAEGFSARFAETLRQEMGNINPFSMVVHEDDLIRALRIGVTDLQKNLPQSREVAFAKVVEKRGKFNKSTKVWAPPEGREVISQRINSYNEPVFLVKATDDEMRNKVNSEESKTQRDFTLRLCPRHILDECEERIRATIAGGDKEDPQGPMKRMVDWYGRRLGVMPSDLEKYIGREANVWTPEDIRTLRDLGTAITDGETTFEEAMRMKFATAEGEPKQPAGSAGAAQDVADKKVADAEKKKALDPDKKQGESAGVPSDTKTEPANNAVEPKRYEHGELPEAPALKVGTRVIYGNQILEVQKMAGDDDNNWGVIGMAPAPAAAADPKKPVPFKRGDK